MNSSTKMLLLQARAMLVHVFTASGLVAGFMALLAINRGAWQEAALWMLLCQVIDGIDGTFARWWRVRELLPEYDGKTIDFVVDFFTYAIIPAYFLYHSALLSAPWNMVAVCIILLVSGVYYGKSGMVSEDHHFVGFPVMWNLIVFFQFFANGLLQLALNSTVKDFAIRIGPYGGNEHILLKPGSFRHSSNFVRVGKVDFVKSIFTTCFGHGCAEACIKVVALKQCSVLL